MTCQINEPISYSEDELGAVVNLFKALADQTRLRILSTLTQRQKICVSDIAESLQMSISRVSHHLRILGMLGFVKVKHEKKQAFYEIDDQCIIDIMKRSQEHVAGS
jgi:DNA-binding transcriptional ArsR family regulator